MGLLVEVEPSSGYRIDICISKAGSRRTKFSVSPDLPIGTAIRNCVSDYLRAEAEKDAKAWLAQF